MSASLANNSRKACSRLWRVVHTQKRRLSQKRTTPPESEFPPVVEKPYPMVRNLATVGLIGTFVGGTYFWTLHRMKSGQEELMVELDDVEGGYSSAGKNMDNS